MSKAYSQFAGRRQAFARVRKGVVGIVKAPAIVDSSKPVDLQTVTILGTGFIVDDLGIVVTAKHVVEPLVRALAAATTPLAPDTHVIKVIVEAPLKVHGNGVSIGWHISMAEEIRLANDLDIATLCFRVNNENKALFKSVHLASSPCAEGDEIAVCGYPFGNDLHREDFGTSRMVLPSFSGGIVSVAFPHPGAPEAMHAHFQLSAMINPGNSGGPVFHPSTGDVVGIVSSAVTTVKRVLADPAGDLNEQPGLAGPAVGAFHQIKIPAGLARAAHIQRALPVIAEARASWAKKK